MSEIHISRAGKTSGPYATPQAEAFYLEGRLKPTDLVWKDGLADWVPAFELFKHLVPTSGHPPPVPSYDRAMPSETLVAASTHSVAMPPPPKLHWGLVLLFSVITLGIFFIVWMFIQSSWVKKIDSTSNATHQLIGYVALLVVGQILTEVRSEGLNGMGLVLIIASYVSFYFGIYSMRRSMLTRYAGNAALNFTLTSGMTFFFNILYLQSRMTYLHQVGASASKR